ELLGHAAQLHDVRVALLALLGPVLQVRRVAGRLDDLVDDRGELPLGDIGPQSLEKAAKSHERPALAARGVPHLLTTQQRLRRGDLLRAGEGQEALARLVADAARRDVQYTRQGDRVLRRAHEAHVREDVLHLAALIEGHAADDLIREPERAKDILDRTALRVGAVE